MAAPTSQAHDDSVRPPVGHAGNVVLASQSPRRRRLLEWLGLPFSVTSVDTPESLDSPLAADPPSLAESLAAEKAQAARSEGLAKAGIVLCFDTIVVLDGRVLGKPSDAADAWRMLRALSARLHQVVTGVALLVPGEAAPRSFSAMTNVAMRELGDSDIETWMAHGSFMGCAGAYNIEAQVAEVADDECYQNVAGLPLCHLFAAISNDPTLAEWLPSVPRCPVAACDTALGRTCKLGPRITQTDASHPS
jgi:septum formation protein